MTVERGRARGSAGSVLRWVSCAAFGIGSLIAGGCGNTTFTYGTAVMVVSASAPGPFTGYLVNIASITFTRTDGTVVQPIIPSSPVTGTEEKLNVTNLIGMSELMGAPAALTGSYTKATVTLDYSTASIWVDVGGEPQAATVVDSSGNGLTTVSYTVTFDPAHPLVLRQGVSTLLDIDFDLSASSVLNTTSSPVKVTVKPFVTISTAPVLKKAIRSRGVFVEADTNAGNFIMNTQPFFDTSSQPFGSLTLQTSAQTSYNINGVNYSGAAGLAVVKSLPVSSFIEAYGTLGSLSAVTPVLNATEVFAGTSLENSAEDRITGVVTARSGNTLTVRGVTVFSRYGVPSYLASLSMAVGSGTVVSIDGQPNATGLSAQSISVGQQIDAGGTLNPPAGTTTAYTSLDATAGLVRLTQTPVWGTLNGGATAASASLDVHSIGGFETSAFSFAGTGASAASNANPADYSLNTGSLDVSATPGGTLLLANGIVTPFGSAPPDFDAASITPGASTDQALIVDWVSGGATAPFLSATSAGLVVNIANSHLGTSHVVQTGPVLLDLTQPEVNPTIVPDPTLTGQFAIGNPANGVFEFNSFSTFLARIGTVLNGTNALQKLVAIGHYDAATGTFTAYRIDLAQQ